MIYPGPCTCGCETFTEVRPYHAHQHIELPEIEMTVIHRILHRGTCTSCGKTGKGYTPKAFQTGFGPRLCALVADIGGIEGNSRQAIQAFCSSVLDFHISLGAIQNIIDRAAKAILPHDEAIGNKARTVAVNHIDETPWKNGGKLNWLWVMASSVVAFFMGRTNRSKVAFESLVGGWEGILVSDGYRLYQNWVHARQSCLAHLIRRAKGLVERQEPELVRCGAWTRDELRRLCKMAKDPPTQAEWNALYARLNRLIALYVATPVVKRGSLSAILMRKWPRCSLS